MAAKYIWGSNQASGAVSKLSATRRTFATSLLQEPGKMENIIGMVRTFAPLTSEQTVSKVNTYLPAIEKVSTLLGMYSFISRAQNYRPIQALDVKNPADKITALLKNGNIPISKMMAQPLLANNMDKIIGALAINMAKSGGLNEILSSLTAEGKSGNTDINSLVETFIPMINNIMSSSEESKKSEGGEFKKSYLPSASSAPSDSEIFKSAAFNHKLEDAKIDKADRPPSLEKNLKQEKYSQKPIRIRQRRRSS